MLLNLTKKNTYLQLDYKSLNSAYTTKMINQHLEGKCVLIKKFEHFRLEQCT